MPPEGGIFCVLRKVRLPATISTAIGLPCASLVQGHRAALAIAYLLLSQRRRNSNIVGSINPKNRKNVNRVGVACRHGAAIIGHPQRLLSMKNCCCRSAICRSVDVAAVRFVLTMYCVYDGYANAAIIATIATTIINSRSVTPRCLLASVQLVSILVILLSN